MLCLLCCDTRFVKQKEIGINCGRGRPGSSNCWVWALRKAQRRKYRRGPTVLGPSLIFRPNCSLQSRGKLFSSVGPLFYFRVWVNGSHASFTMWIRHWIGGANPSTTHAPSPLLTRRCWYRGWGDLLSSRRVNPRHFGGKVKLTGFSANVALVTETSYQMLEVTPFNVNNRANKP